jgi:hypothetical protein
VLSRLFLPFGAANVTRTAETIDKAVPACYNKLDYAGITAKKRDIYETSEYGYAC